MAWTAVEDFNSYSDGDLPGNNGGSGWSGAWSGSANFDVQGTTVYEGAKAIENTTSSNVSRSLTTALSGDGHKVYVAHRRTANNSGQSVIGFDNSVPVHRVTIVFNASGNIVGDGTTILAGYSANTWYVLRVTLNTDADTYTVAYSTDAYGSVGTFSSESPAITMGGASSTDITAIFLDIDVGGDGYWDYISGSNPFVEAGIKSGWFM